VKDYMATFTIKPGETADSTTINWLASYQAQGKSEAEAKAVIESVFDGGLKSLGELAAK